MARFLIKKNGKNRKKENDGTRLEIEKIYEMNFKIHVRTPKAACKSKSFNSNLSCKSHKQYNHVSRHREKVLLHMTK